MTSLLARIIARVVMDVASCERLDREICSIAESRINTDDSHREILFTSEAKKSYRVTTCVVRPVGRIRRLKIFFAITRYF
jgi:hypothetical protein